jgi:drug/metabolite transporter (DMT)-like permease
MRIFGITLIVIGILAVALPYFTFTKREKVLDVGPIEAVSERQENIPVSPIVGIVIVAAGAVLVVSSVVKGRK